MCTVNEIPNVLFASPELRQTIVQQIGSFTVALFAVFDSQNGERLELAGTGTLFENGGARFVLTAAHVWELVLKGAVKFGVNLIEGINHCFWIDPRTVILCSLPYPNSWGEWGPDLILIRIPSEHLGSINARKSFYDPRIDGAAAFALKRDHVEIWLLMGTPAARGRFTQNHAEVEINGRFLPDVHYQTRDGLDYFDLKMDASIVGASQSFGGVSGGGLWKILLYCSSDGKIEWVQTLEGVAFHQSDIDNGYRTIRCHGPRSVLAVAAL